MLWPSDRGLWPFGPTAQWQPSLVALAGFAVELQCRYRPCKLCLDYTMNNTAGCHKFSTTVGVYSSERACSQECSRKSPLSAGTSTPSNRHQLPIVTKVSLETRQMIGCFGDESMYGNKQKTRPTTLCVSDENGISSASDAPAASATASTRWIVAGDAKRCDSEQEQITSAMLYTYNCFDSYCAGLPGLISHPQRYLKNLHNKWWRWS